MLDFKLLMFKKTRQMNFINIKKKLLVYAIGSTNIYIIIYVIKHVTVILVIADNRKLEKLKRNYNLKFDNFLN